MQFKEEVVENKKYEEVLFAIVSDWCDFC